MSKPQPDEMRKRYRYRQAILRGRLALPRAAARALLGPDCAYHLYSQSGGHPQAAPDGIGLGQGISNADLTGPDAAADER